MKSAPLLICQLNCQSISTTNRTLELEEALGRIKFDVVGLTETWRQGSNIETFTNSGHMLFFSGGKFKRRGTGFIVARHLAKSVVTFKPISDRCCYIILKIDGVAVTFVQGYGPTSDASDADYEDFLNKLHEATCNARGELLSRNGRVLAAFGGRPHLRCTILMADFNASIGKKSHMHEPAVGEYGYGNRNVRGQQLANFCCANGWVVANSFSKQRSGRKWTWRSPNGTTKKEIDLFLVRNVRLVRCVRVVNQFNYRSDHRLVRMEMELQLKTTRRRNHAPRINSRINWPLFQHAVLQSGMSDAVVPDSYTTLVVALQEAKLIATEPHLREARISARTHDLFQKRHLLVNKTDPSSRVELAVTNKAIRCSMADDIRNRQHRLYLKTLSSRRLFEHVTTKTVWHLSKTDGTLTSTPSELQNEIKEFYNLLYKCSVNVPLRMPTTPEHPQSFTEEEVKYHLKRLKRRTAPGHDQITSLMLYICQDNVVPVLTNLFNYILHTGHMPDTFADSITTLIPKKGDPLDVSNYRPISVLPSPYKLFIRMLYSRMHRTLEENQPPEQAGFRRLFLTTEHVHSINQLIEKCNTYGMQLYLVFVDFKKAYDSVEWNAVWNALTDHGVDQTYISLLKTAYESASSKVKVNDVLVDVNIKRGVRQGCVISPAIFNAVLENIFRSLDWDNIGIKINGRMLNHLRYADDVVLIGRSIQAVQKMLTELDIASAAVGLEISSKKTVAMGNIRNGNLTLRNHPVQFVNSFIYLGCKVSCREDSTELSRRIGSGWAAFNRHRSFLCRRNIPMRLKRKVFMTCVIPSMMYACEVWTLRREQIKKLQVVQRRMERSMLDLTVLDRIPSDELRHRTMLPDVIDLWWKRKTKWARTIANMNPNRWSRTLTEWTPMNAKRNRGRPKLCWHDDIRNTVAESGRIGATWMTLARANTDEWRTLVASAR